MTIREQADPQLAALRVTAEGLRYDHGAIARDLATARFGLFMALEADDLHRAADWLVTLEAVVAALPPSCRPPVETSLARLREIIDGAIKEATR